MIIKLSFYFKFIFLNFIIVYPFTKPNLAPIIKIITTGPYKY